MKIPIVKTNIPLIDAVLAGDLEAVQILIAQGVDLEVCDEDGRTPLHAVIFQFRGRGCDHPELMACVKALLDAGADPLAIHVSNYRNIMHYAVIRHDSELVKVLKSHGMKILSSCSLVEFIKSCANSYFRSEIKQYLVILDLLLDEQPDLNQTTDDEHQRTALHLACRQGQHGAIESLLQAGCDPQYVDSRGCAPLVDLVNYAWRSQTDCVFSVFAFVRCGADVNNLGTEPDAETLLNCLVAYGGNRLCVVTLLLESGADPNKPNHKGETPLIHAAESNRSDLIQVLLMFGAKVYQVDDKGLTALDHARNSNQQDAIAVLERNSGTAEECGVQVMVEPFRLRNL